MEPTTQQPATPRPPKPTTGDALQVWGWSLLALFLVLIAGITAVAIARKFTLGRAGVGTKHRKQRRTNNASAWEESGRRMPTPDADLKEEP